MTPAEIKRAKNGLNKLRSIYNGVGLPEHMQTYASAKLVSLEAEINRAEIANSHTGMNFIAKCFYKIFHKLKH